MLRSDRRALTLLTLLFLTLTLPFVRRAYFVDDFYFVTIAKGLIEHPTRPYDFVADDAGIGTIGWERGKAPRMVNPLLLHYSLALIMKVWGEEIWKLRTATLLFSLIALFATYFLGKRFVKNSLAATSLLALTPAFWLSSYSLLIDSALLCFFMLALLAFVIGQERQDWRWWVFSGVSIGCALLSKYTGFLIFPVIVSWHLLHRRSCTWKGTGLSLGIGMALFLLWGVWNIATYGEMHITATFARGFHPVTSLGLVFLIGLICGIFVRWCFPQDRRAIGLAWLCWIVAFGVAFYIARSGMDVGTWLQVLYLDKFIAVASFLGGCSVFLFFVPVLIGKRSLAMLGVWLASTLALYLCFHSSFGGFDALQSGTLAFFIGATLAFMLRLASSTTAHSSRSTLFLAAWALMGILEIVLVMPWTAARYLLILLPPIVWLFQEWTEREGYSFIRKCAWATTALVGMALAYADYAQAGVIEPLSERLAAHQAQFQSIAPRPAHHWYYLADTFDGSQPYVLKWGWENVFPNQKFASGDLFLRAVYRKSSWWKVSSPERFEPLAVWDVNSWIPFRVMDVPASAGFYASCWGVLPYAITRHPLERFELFLVK